MEPDVRKSLPMLRAEWETCTACDLGQRRQAMDGAFVFGEGTTGGIMLIGEGPGKNEEADGRPFVGRSGLLLRAIMHRLHITDYYITNIVSCRSCEARTNEDGTPRISKSYGGRPGRPQYQDRTPIKAQIDACKPRLQEEIYLVDPVVIVALGGTAASTLRGSSVSITKERGTAEEIEIPGATWRQDQNKAGAWGRKVKGEYVRPVVQNEVRYLMIPTLHPAYVLRSLDPTHPNEMAMQSDFKHLVDDMRQAVDVYNRHMLEVYGVVPGELSGEIPYDVLTDIAEDDELAKEHGVNV